MQKIFHCTSKHSLGSYSNTYATLLFLPIPHHTSHPFTYPTHPLLHCPEIISHLENHVLKFSHQPITTLAVSVKVNNYVLHTYKMPSYKYNRNIYYNNTSQVSTFDDGRVYQCKVIINVTVLCLESTYQVCT